MMSEAPRPDLGDSHDIVGAPSMAEVLYEHLDELRVREDAPISVPVASDTVIVDDGRGVECQPDAFALALVDRLIAIIASSRAETQRVLQGGATTIGTDWLLVFDDSESICLVDGEALIIGRSEGQGRKAVRIPSASRSHLHVEVNNGNVFARDLHSTNGTTVRRANADLVLRAGIDFQLEHGDVIMIAFRPVLLVEASSPA